ncbi:hypothetical protein P43SY_003867 [Pythium insidiosum]|uniref:TKL protein kinase n=1 Tax=Pythium insidiosum TaxID=114742 RepID=A0AAD5LUJ2_PYTIN|nr:hypothetical protein P43SY_003867 [Pythium insidiosum]
MGPPFRPPVMDETKHELVLICLCTQACHRLDSAAGSDRWAPQGFGVVLSELDTHDMPYAHATEPETGRKLPDTAILQLVSLGRLQVAFTKSAQESEMTALALACVALDPRERPSTAEVLYRIHKVGKGGFC